MNPGEELDHYRIERVVARSRTATVYRATDARTGMPVAVKIPHAEMEGDPGFFDRFQREEEIGKNLHHPGLLKFIAEDRRSRRYLVTEWFDGQPLKNILAEQRKLSPERAVRISLSVCDALAYIHGHGIVHRNLQPEKILVDGGDHIKLTGFDVAAKEGAPRITFTSLAQIVGTSPYISPEELKGKRGDARGDIFSLGVILYEMLTGKTPFPGTDPFERLQQHPVPPREIEPSISPQLQEVIYRALEREHKNRYATAHEFATDLAHLDRVGVAERRELREWKARKAQTLRKVVLFIALALIPIAIFGLLIYLSRH